MPKICPNCKTVLGDDAIFCSECGTKAEFFSESGNVGNNIPHQNIPNIPPVNKPQTPPDIPPVNRPQTPPNIPPVNQPQTPPNIPPVNRPQTPPNIPPVTPPPDINTNAKVQQTPPPKKDKGGMIACGCAVGCFGVFVIAVIFIGFMMYNAYSSGVFEETLDDIGIESELDEYVPDDLTDSGNVENSENNENTEEHMFSDLADTDDFEYLYSDDFAQEPPTHSVLILDQNKYLGEWKVCCFPNDDSIYTEKYLNLYVEEDLSQDASNYTGIPVKAQVRPSVSIENGEYKDISYEETYHLTGVSYTEGENTYLYLADENDNIFNLVYLYDHNNKQYSSGYYYDSTSQTLFNCEMARP